jgi:predicted DCC family thiol-disulfide oxidoreductase YuxK
MLRPSNRQRAVKTSQINHHGDVSENPTGPSTPLQPTWMFYDGGCGVCHTGVKFVAGRDDEGAVHFAPLGGATHLALVPAGSPARDVDSVVAVQPDGTVLLRSDAIAQILTAIGGRWGVVGKTLRAVPRPIRDAGYNLVARNRKRLAKAPSEACPVLPVEIRNRFSD